MTNALVTELKTQIANQQRVIDAMLSEITDITRRIGPARQVGGIREELEAFCFKYRYRQRSGEPS